MALPIRTTVEDIHAVCSYLSTKPTGATPAAAKAVIDSKFLDGRKLSALKFWGLIEETDNDKLKVTAAGRDCVRENGTKRPQVCQQIIAGVGPYRAIVERLLHRGEDSITALDVASHWHEHFPNEVSENDSVLNLQAVCFFQVATGASLGTITIGRKGAPTRFDLDRSNARQFAHLIEGGHEKGDIEVAIDDVTQKHANEPTENVLPRDAERTVRTEAFSLGQGIFVAHGKNKKPLEQLKKILDQFKIPYKVAVEEPNLGRPIGAKVREIMQACNCAILIFTADEEFTNSDGDSVWRPSENVVFELGASGFLYENRIVIMKENDVDFPSNFRDLGYISFAKDALDAKAMEILRELIGFGIVKIST